jgi:hypothetical protein
METKTATATATACRQQLREESWLLFRVINVNRVTYVVKIKYFLRI